MATRESNFDPIDGARRGPTMGKNRTSVLIVDSAPRSRETARRAIENAGKKCVSVASLAEARSALQRHNFDVVVVGTALRDGHGLELVRELKATGSLTSAIVVGQGDEQGVEDIVEAMRHGAVDFLHQPYESDDLASRVVDAARAVERTRSRLEADGPATAGRIGPKKKAREKATFEQRIRKELDVESLLRRTLEHILDTAGPTNAAVFLPTGSNDYSLGAYVNCDIPKDVVDVLLDHLADVLAPNLEDRTEIVRPTDETDLAAMLGEDATWLAGSEMVAFSCTHQGECLAIVALFRDRSRPFPRDLDGALETARVAFAAQMARIIRIHHRHKPQDERPGFETGDWDDIGGLAA
ncbi:MAG TPA: response regulator [Phycisphaerales bacterium]|nr:response regulator [Phycisphaerales bacterium]